jgi:transcriptional repressor NrdR
VRCPFCLVDDDKVVDSRPAEDGIAVRRRRECLACGRRFTTQERIVEQLAAVYGHRPLVPGETLYLPS